MTGSKGWRSNYVEMFGEFIKKNVLIKRKRTLKVKKEWCFCLSDDWWVRKDSSSRRTVFYVIWYSILYDNKKEITQLVNILLGIFLVKGLIPIRGFLFHNTPWDFWFCLCKNCRMNCLKLVWQLIFIWKKYFFLTPLNFNKILVFPNNRHTMSAWVVDPKLLIYSCLGVHVCI